MSHSPLFEGAGRADYLWNHRCPQKVVLEPRLYEAQVEIMLVAQAWENNRAVAVRSVTANLGKPARVFRPVLRESIYWELYSRALVDLIIEELGLQKHYGRRTLSETRMALEVSRHIRMTSWGTLQVLVVDRDPAMAAAIANAHARQLDRLDQKLGAELASVRKRFYQKRMDEVFAKLRHEKSSSQSKVTGPLSSVGSRKQSVIL